MRLPLALLVLASAPAVSAKEGERVAVVRFVSVNATPPGWLELEERLTTLLEADGEVVDASAAADASGTPAARWDRARARLRQSLDKARAALTRGDDRAALSSLRDCDDLLEVGGVVAVAPADLLRGCHRLRAMALTLSLDAQAARALRQYAALLEVSVEGDSDLPQDLAAQVMRELAEKQPGGLAVETTHSDASVYLDGVLLGRGALRRYDVRPGRHYLRVLAPGRAAHGERLQIDAGEILRRRVALEIFDDRLPERGAPFFAPTVDAAGVAAATTLARQLKARQLLLLAEHQGVTLRIFSTAEQSFGPLASIPIDASDADLHSALDQARGVASAAQAIAAQPVSETATPLAATSGEVTPAASRRWLWLGGGAVAVAAVVTGILWAARANESPDHVAVWLCPGGQACAH